jgi:hypothetical protein
VLCIFLCLKSGYLTFTFSDLQSHHCKRSEKKSQHFACCMFICIYKRISQWIIILWVNTIKVPYILILSKSLVEEIPMRHAHSPQLFCWQPT